MAGSPKKRARRLAMEAAKARGETYVEPAKPSNSETWSGKPTSEKPAAPRPRAEKPQEMVSGAGIMAAADRVGKPEQFETLLGLALDKAVSIMQLDLDKDHREFGRLLSIQSSIASGVFSVTARVSGDNLRRAKTDELGKLLKTVRREAGESVDVSEAEESDGGDADNAEDEVHELTLEDML